MQPVFFKKSFISDKKKLRELLDFYLSYRENYHKFFIKLKYEWLKLSGWKTIPGACSEINSITGKWPEPAPERLWSWGDGRGLSIWSYHLMKNVISDKETEIKVFGETKKVNLRREYEEYCDIIYKSLDERAKLNYGHFPFITDPKTNKPSSDPRNKGAIITDEKHRTASDFFCSVGIMQYGLMKADERIIRNGLDILKSFLYAAGNGLVVSEVLQGLKPRNDIKMQGSFMLVVGACVDVIKSIDCLKSSGREFKFDWLLEELSSIADSAASSVLEKFCDSEKGILWELNDLGDKPVKDEKTWLVDPGHSAECSAFIAEFVALIRKLGVKSIPEERLNKYLKTVANINIFVDSVGYNKKTGLMYKRANLMQSGDLGWPDAEFEGKPVRTAPWWNVREQSAASLKIYCLTGNTKHLEAYEHAQHPSYKLYPNPALDGLMLQTLDADTAKPLPLNPATANFDPMHDARARDREIESLETLV